MQGQPGETLGVVPPAIRTGATESDLKAFTKACRAARRVAHLSISWRLRRMVVCCGVTAAL
eukprot:5714466-Alexandrium_andersonii.AAC.1